MHTVMLSDLRRYEEFPDDERVEWNGDMYNLGELRRAAARNDDPRGHYSEMEDEANPGETFHRPW